MRHIFATKTSFGPGLDHDANDGAADGFCGLEELALDCTCSVEVAWADPSSTAKHAELLMASAAPVTSRERFNTGSVFRRTEGDIAIGQAEGCTLGGDIGVLQVHPTLRLTDAQKSNLRERSSCGGSSHPH